MVPVLSYRGQAALCQHLSLSLIHTHTLTPSLPPSLPLSGLAFFTIPWSSYLGGVTPWCTHPSTSSLSTPVISKLRVLAACRGWESVTRNSFSPIPHGTMCCFGSRLVPLVDGLTVLPPSPSQVWQKEIKNSHAPAPAQISLRGERIPSFSMIRSIISEASNRTSCPFSLSPSLSLPLARNFHCCALSDPRRSEKVARDNRNCSPRPSWGQNSSSSHNIRLDLARSFEPKHRGTGIMVTSQSYSVRDIACGLVRKENKKGVAVVLCDNSSQSLGIRLATPASGCGRLSAIRDD